MKKTTSLLILFVFFGWIAAMADGEPSVNPVAKSAKIEGKVLDLVTGETLAGVAVSIKFTDRVTYTDFDGCYSFDNLKPGTYNFVASYISYNNSLIEDVELDPEHTREIIIQLQASK